MPRTQEVSLAPASYVFAAPTVASCSPSTGDVAGGTSVVITGTGFLPSATVTVGGNSATGVTYLSPTNLIITTPAGSIGSVDVVVTNTSTGQSGTGASVFTYTNSWNPSVLSLTGWWRDYSGSPWNGASSAGTSGSNNLSAPGTAPTVGSPVNGHTPAVIVPASSTYLSSGSSKMDTFVASSSYSAAVLLYASSASAYGSDEYDNPGVFCSGGAGATIWGAASFSTSGVSSWHYNAGWPGQTVSCGTGAWHLAQIRYSTASGQEVKIDSGSWNVVSIGDITYSLTSESMQIGANYSASKFFDGNVLEALVTNTYLSDTDFNNIKTYMNNRYSLSL